MSGTYVEVAAFLSAIIKRKDPMTRFPLMSAAALLGIAMAGPASALPVAKMATASSMQPEPLVENV
ncbi:hypothetical protein ACQ1Z2_15125, partial [Enterococcus faecalis]|uniref:hypothetical protein n=1 Tax=Enterococcus faecalis TaxID=1351 RepID=UPI003D6BCC54